MKESPFFSRDIGGERKERKHGIRKFSGCSTEFDWLERPFLIQSAGREGGGVLVFQPAAVSSLLRRLRSFSSIQLPIGSG